MVSLTQEDFETLAICAIRYCHGRQTYMPSLVQGICRNHLKDFSDGRIKILAQDCEWMNEYDYGDPGIDKPGWKIWEQDVIAEKERRKL